MVVTNYTNYKNYNVLDDNTSCNFVPKYYYDNNYFIKSAPITLIWDGWEATTLSLQRNGWQLSAEQDFASHSLRILMKNAKSNLYALSDSIGIDYFRYDHYSKIIIPVNRVFAKAYIELIERSFDFKPIDAETQFINRQRKDIEDFAIFAPALIRTNEIVVPNQSVDDLLSKILEMQDPMLKKYYKEQALNEYAESSSMTGRPEHKFVAQIISLDRKTAA